MEERQSKLEALRTHLAEGATQAKKVNLLKVIQSISERWNNAEINMKHSENQCPICHGGNKQPGVTTFTVELGEGVVVVRDVPSLVCDLCGTDWIEDPVAERLEKIVEQARLNHSIVEVANWSTVEIAA